MRRGGLPDPRTARQFSVTEREDGIFPPNKGRWEVAGVDATFC